MVANRRTRSPAAAGLLMINLQPMVATFDWVAEPHRFARDESQLPGSIGRDAKRICRGLMMARIGWVELREERLGAGLRYFKKQLASRHYAGRLGGESSPISAARMQVKIVSQAYI